VNTWDHLVTARDRALSCAVNRAYRENASMVIYRQVADPASVYVQHASLPLPGDAEALGFVSPFYPPPIPTEPPWRWLTPTFFTRRQALLDLPGSRVITPHGAAWDPRAIWNGGQGGPPQGSVILSSEARS
jgi:hypothetical protein